MAGAFDGETILSGSPAAADPWTASGKTTAGSDRVGILRLIGITAGGAPSAVTWNGVAMTLIGSVTDFGPGGVYTARAYYIVAPPTGASDVVVDWATGQSGYYVVTSYNGVNPADVIGDFQTAAGSDATATLDITAATGDLVLDLVDALNTITVGASQTQEIQLDGGTHIFGASREAGASTVTMSWTLPGSAAWDILAFSLNQASSGEEITGDGALTNTAQTLAGAATRGIQDMGSPAELTLPAMTLAGEATVGEAPDVTGDGALTLSAVTLAGAATVTEVPEAISGDGALALRSFTLHALAAVNGIFPSTRSYLAFPVGFDVRSACNVRRRGSLRPAWQET